MKRILFPVLLIAASAVLLGIGAVACGDDDDDDDAGTATATGSTDGESPLVDYLTEVNDIENSVTTATNAIGDQSEDAFSDPARARQALSAAIDAAEAAVASLKALEPVPETAQDEHDALVSSGEALVEVVQGLNDELQGMSAGAAFDQFADDAQAADSDLSNAINAGVDACEAMSQLATDNDVEHIECPERVE
jgi:hypothetical protein